MRHSILANHIDFEHTVGLVLDARSITQLLYMHSIIGGRFSEENTILLWKADKTMQQKNNKFKEPIPINCN